MIFIEVKSNPVKNNGTCKKVFSCFVFCLVCFCLCLGGLKDDSLNLYVDSLHRKNDFTDVRRMHTPRPRVLVRRLLPEEVVLTGPFQLTSSTRTWTLGIRNWPEVSVLKSVVMFDHCHSSFTSGSTPRFLENYTFDPDLTFHFSKLTVLFLYWK